MKGFNKTHEYSSASGDSVNRILPLEAKNGRAGNEVYGILSRHFIRSKNPRHMSVRFEGFNWAIEAKIILSLETG